MSAHSARSSRQSPVRRAVGWAAIGSGVAALIAGLSIAPPDAVQGNAARLFYLHVPAAWTAYLAYVVVLVCSVQYLRSGHDKWDRYGGTAAEIGVAMTALTIAVGSLWGKAVWGVWWAWDPRLVSTAMMLLIYAAYVFYRRTGTGDSGHLRRTAWLGTVGALIIPVVHFSVVWWRSLHQPATLLAPTIRPPIDPLMGAALSLAIVAFTLAAAWLFLWRTGAARVGADEPTPAVR